MGTFPCCLCPTAHWLQTDSTLLFFLAAFSSCVDFSAIMWFSFVSWRLDLPAKSIALIRKNRRRNAGRIVREKLVRRDETEKDARKRKRLHSFTFSCSLCFQILFIFMFQHSCSDFNSGFKDLRLFASFQSFVLIWRQGVTFFSRNEEKKKRKKRRRSR